MEDIMYGGASWAPLSPDSGDIAGSLMGNFVDGSSFHRNLQKALSSGSTIDTTLVGSQATEASALRLEDLSGVLTTQVRRMEQIVLYKWLKRGAVFNTAYQWDTLSSFGNKEVSPFFLEGGRPIAADDVYTRYLRNVKRLGVELSITLDLLLQRTGGGVPDIKSRTTKNGVIKLLTQTEIALFYGREELDTTGLAFDGIEQQLLDGAPAENIIDLRGYALTPGKLDDAIQIMADNNSQRVDIGLFLSNDGLTNLTKPYRQVGANSIERVIISEKDGAWMQSGSKIKGFATNFGDIPYYPDVFLGERREKMKLSDYITAIGGTNAPNAIPSGSILVDLAVDATSQLAADTYWWTISACNRYGVSTPISTASGIAVPAGAKATIKWTAPTVVPAGGAPVKYFLWRHTADPTVTANQASVKLIRELTATGTLEYEDLDQWMPGTGVAFMLDGEMENLCRVELSPLMRMPQAQIGTSFRSLLLKFDDVAVRDPKKQILFKNVGKLT